MMPDAAVWPRDADGAPLHFIAQIACEDLPADLWNGQGPRKGWLLVFAETLKLEDFAERGMVQVLHTKQLGPECAPPEDTPTVRHTMSDYIDYAAPNVRPGVPKLWRKWPVDLVEQRYDLDEDSEGPPHIPAEELYGAPVSDGWMRVDFEELDLTRPLTWRGALYVIERLVRDLDPVEYKRNWVGNRFGMLAAPDLDTIGFGEEEQRRALTQTHYGNLESEWGPRVRAAREALEAQLTSDREDTWLKRAFMALEAKTIGFEEKLEDARRTLDEARGTGQTAEEMSRLRGRVRYYILLIRETEGHCNHLSALDETYPGLQGLAALSTEIEQMGQAHLAWADQMRSELEQWLVNFRGKDLDALLPEDVWNKIQHAIETPVSPHWRKTGNPSIAIKTETGLSIAPHLKMAIREDVLDLYTRDANALQMLSEEQRDLLECKMRYVEEWLPHRMGGQANPVQDDLDPNETLLFQIATDSALGWMLGGYWCPIRHDVGQGPSQISV